MSFLTVWGPVIAAAGYLVYVVFSKQTNLLAPAITALVTAIAHARTAAAGGAVKAEVQSLHAVQQDHSFRLWKVGK